MKQIVTKTLSALIIMQLIACSENESTVGPSESQSTIGPNVGILNELPAAEFDKVQKIMELAIQPDSEKGWYFPVEDLLVPIFGDDPDCIGLSPTKTVLSETLDYEDAQGYKWKTSIGPNAEGEFKICDEGNAQWYKVTNEVEEFVNGTYTNSVFSNDFSTMNDTLLVIQTARVTTDSEIQQVAEANIKVSDSMDNFMDDSPGAEETGTTTGTIQYTFYDGDYNCSSDAEDLLEDEDEDEQVCRLMDSSGNLVTTFLITEAQEATYSIPTDLVDLDN